MKIKIHQAKYGTQGPLGHSLLATSMADRSFANILAQKTDLPSNPPYKVEVESYYSCFHWRSNLIVARTYKDTEANRLHSVIAHALIIDQENISDIVDLEAIFNLIPKELDRSIELSPIVFEIAESFHPSEFDSQTDAIATLLLDNEKLDEPVICLGKPDEYLSTYCRIWNTIPIDFKLCFELHIGFSSEKIARQNNLVISPEQLSSKWQDFRVYRGQKLPANDSAAKYWLLGDHRAKPFLEFLKSIAYKPENFRQLLQAERVFQLAQKIEDKPELVVDLAKEIGALGQTSNRSSKYKKDIFHRSLEYLKSSSMETWLRMRNFPMQAFGGSELSLTQSLSSWIKKSYSDLSNQNQNTVLESCVNADNRSWWKNGIKSGIENLLLAYKEKDYADFWANVVHDPEFVPLLSGLLPNEVLAENLLYASIPEKLPKHVSTLFRELSVKHTWKKLHAILVGKSCPFQKAVSLQLQMDNKPDSSDGLFELNKWISDTDWLEETLKRKDNRMIYIAAQNSILTPTLFTDLDVNNETWRMIWWQRILRKGGNSIWDAIAAPKSICNQLIQLIANQKKVEKGLIEAAAKTVHFDPLNLANRISIWDQIPITVKDIVLNRTANSFLEKVISEQTFPGTIENVLRNKVATIIEHEQFKIDADADGAMILAFFSRLNLSENILLSIIKNRTAYFNGSQAEKIGQLVLDKEWTQAAKFFKKQRKVRQDYKKAYKICKDLAPLSPWSSITEFIDDLLEGQNNIQNINKMKTKILFASANPFGQQPIRTDLEQRKIVDRLARSNHRDKFKLKTIAATEFMTFAQEFAEFEPEIVHFSGHGDDSGLVFETTEGDSHLVEADAVESIFDVLNETVKCVVLNACYSKKQARKISKSGIYVVGMSDEIPDDAAGGFSEGFYIAIAAGQSFESAFRLGKTAIKASGNKDSYWIPQLWYKGEVVS